MSFKKLNKLKLTSLCFFLIVIYSDFTNNLHQHISYSFYPNKRKHSIRIKETFYPNKRNIQSE